MDAHHYRRLHNLTELLREKNRMAHDQFVDRTRKEGYETNFYEEVKPFADDVQQLVDDWKPLALAWIKERRPQYLFPQQINDTSDNLTIIAVTAFQKDTRRRRFLETIKSIDYVLNSI
ncbi:YppE family protein [Terrilactibacillus sp. S3-3]|nr:YppE family protein [Terrilactibacillus sp. S3-3]